jgi:tagatose 6-phosphate kinase
MILAAGLTPAWQQILLFDAFQLGEVNRARETHWCASGKVLNVGIALYHLGRPCKTLALIGGSAGREIEREFSEHRIPARWIESSQPTRTCTTILDTQTCMTTELVENSKAPTEEELAAFIDAYRDEAARADVVVLSGSLPANTPADFYRRLLEHTPGRAVLDIRGEELLQTLDLRPFLVKPNREELGKTLQRELNDDARLTAAMQELNRRGAEWVVVSQGKQAVWATSGGEVHRIEPLAAPVVNPIGCGDCLAAGVATALDEGRQPLEAICFGLAAAAENLGSVLPARLNRQSIEQSAGNVQILDRHDGG